jgi:hexosaminidase
MRILSLFAVLGAAHALWPRPQHSAAGSTPLLLSPSFTITFSSSLPHPPQDLRDAATRTHAQLFGDKLGRLVPDRGASDVPRLAHAPALAQLELALVPGAPAAQSISAEATKPLGSRVEGCTLRVPTSGHATITANSTLGLLRGLTTFSQMWWTADGKVYLLDAPVEVNDAPAYVRRRSRSTWRLADDFPAVSRIHARHLP